MTTQDAENTSDISPADYQDLDLERLQLLANYITQNSVPLNMTFREVQQVVEVYTDLLNLSLHNLNLLRQLAGEEKFPIPVKEDIEEVSSD